MLPDRSLSGPHLARLLGAWRAPGSPAYASLARALRLLVLDGRLPLRTRLPGERELAEALGVSRTTATAAYAALREEGFLASRRGAGSWTRLPADPGVAPEPGPSGSDGVIDLSCAAGAAPEGALHTALETAAAELPRHLPGPGYDAAGLPVLRARIADWFTGRGVPTEPEQILVTAGAQHAWTLLLRVLAGPGDRVLTEHPTYPAALDAVRALGARPVPVPMLPGGWDLDMFAVTLRQAAPRIAYVIADHHNPTGLTLPAADRERLVALARATRTPLVIDETGLELRLDGTAPPPAVATFDPGGETVIVTGSMSKAFWAGLRVGWVRASPALVRRLAAARAALDIAGPVIEQLVAVALLAEGETVVARQRTAARERRDALAAAIKAHLPAWRFEVPAGGLSLWIELGAPRSTALAAVADRHGLRLAAGPRFGVDGAFERFLRVPFSLPAPVLEEAAARLALAWRAVGAAGVSAAEPEPALVA
ncbi:MAG TPA: PLP-dependent aminotransferase family protein [Solirubrobacter sp.]|nr:PLP-dependent aminotransferase family protein [Solirubrobacter sp.]